MSSGWYPMKGILRTRIYNTTISNDAVNIHIPLGLHFNRFILYKSKSFFFENISKVWQIVWQFLKRLKKELLYDPGGPLLGMYPKESIADFDRTTMAA